MKDENRPKIAAIRGQVYGNSPAVCDLIDQIVSATTRLDQYTDQYSTIAPLEDAIVDVLWKAHGKPQAGKDWPSVDEEEPLEAPPVDEEEAKEADAAPHQRGKHKG